MKSIIEQLINDWECRATALAGLKEKHEIGSEGYSRLFAKQDTLKGCVRELKAAIERVEETP